MKLLRYMSLHRFARRQNKIMRPKRETISWWVAIFSIGVLMLVIGYAADTRLFMPGPMTTAHSTLEQCSDCHSNVPNGKFGWLHTIVATASPRKDSSSCLKCHKMGVAALNPHSLELAKLDGYVRRLDSSPVKKLLPIKSRIRNAVFPVESTFQEGVFCATCHKEHQGEDFELKEMADAQCHTCHRVQFNNFHSDHPKFDNYPFRRRTRINFDHSGHFKKHFPEWRAKKTNSAAAPSSCTDCHAVNPGTGHMKVKPFAQICSSCHLDQIIGTERATGPKGIALLTLPGLDVDTLKQKNVQIGTWPEEAEGELSPLMKLLIGRDEERRKILEAIHELDLLDLTEATPVQIAQVEKLAWEVKRLLHALATSAPAEILKPLMHATRNRIDQRLIAQLIARLPRDVLFGAQREWLPGLADEIGRRSDKKLTSSLVSTPNSNSAKPGNSASNKATNSDQKLDTSSKKQAAKKDPVERAASKKAKSWRIDPFGHLIKGNRSPEDSPDEQASDDAERQTEKIGSDTETFVDRKAGDEKEREPALQEVDAESWAELGGWYRKDHSILYRPAGHADRFLRAWLDFTAELFSEADGNLAASAFKELTGKDAQGQCTKCHSVEAARDNKRIMKWMPSSYATRESPFTSFSHEPHLGLVKDKGCLTCHDMSGAKGYLETYKGHDPYNFVSNFKPVKKEICASCHGQRKARQDCLLCHKYHVNEITTPITKTKIPEK